MGRFSDGLRWLPSNSPAFAVSGGVCTRCTQWNLPEVGDALRDQPSGGQTVKGAKGCTTKAMVPIQCQATFVGDGVIGSRRPQLFEVGFSQAMGNIFMIDVGWG